MKKSVKVISVQLDEDLYNVLKEDCLSREQPLQGLIRFLLKQYIYNKK